VRALEDYARAFAYLGGLDLVSGLQVKEVTADAVRFDLEARGGRPALEQTFSLGRTLARESVSAGAGAAGRFRLLPP
jgi:hypothetical protein